MFSVNVFKPRIGRALVPFLGLLVLALAGLGTSSADDRDLLRSTSKSPYVMIILDTSGSMSWTPTCTQAQLSAGTCDTLCPFRDCFARLQSDDASSKFYQAKQALYEVLQSITSSPGVQFGFSTYNQDDLQIKSKHWIYTAGAGGISIPGSTAKTFPAPGTEEVFGALFACDNGNGSSEVGCTFANPADLDDPWEVTRLQRLAKGGTLFNQTVTGYIRWGGVIYEVTYAPVVAPATPLGSATIVVNVDVDKCTSTGTCTTDFDNKNITYSLSFTNGLADELISWENGGINTVSTAASPTLVYYTSNDDLSSSISTTCDGWDPNTDATADAHSGYNLRFPTAVPADPRGALFTSGDVIPFDWLTDHKTDIMNRLAPNRITAPAATPDFRISPYLNNLPVAGQAYLQLKSTLVRPLISSGSTPLANTLNTFRTWYDSWKVTAAAADPDWGCRRKFVLLITDGDDTCSSPQAPCDATQNLFLDGVQTYVVAFGLANVSGNTLACMATNGGTGAPIYPQNKSELVTALTQIFGEIQEQASSFASAAVPTVQTEVADKIYISNFTPLNPTPVNPSPPATPTPTTVGAYESVWNGHIDSYLKPLPLTSAGLPNRGIDCATANPRSACHLWDAATQLLLQAPTAASLNAASTIDAAALRLGLSGQTQRRVFYGKADPGTGSLPRALRLFYPPPGAATTDADWLDLFQGFNLPSAAPPSTARTTSAAQVTAIMKRTLVIRSGTIDNGTPSGLPVSYVLGDTFHADPIIVDRPNDFDRYAAKLYDNGLACGEDASGRPANPSYRCWADKLKHRRKVVAVAANDGQLHFFDAGIYQSGATIPFFDDGGGWELFSYIPRLALPIVRDQQATPPPTPSHTYGLDSSPRVQEVFIDPFHNGTPALADRQWRTVAIGGFREGGKPLVGDRIDDFISGYYALDITQPDTLNAGGNPTTALVPSCLTLGNTATATPAGCGPLPYPALLWEFTDSLAGSRLDEDANGTADLGQTWSVPVIGRIQTRNSSGVVEDRYVAIFGGGMDAESKLLGLPPQAGSYLYILDVETGKVIYKQKLDGAIVGDPAGSTPADPAVIDSDNNGVLDTIYIGTTAGFLYKVDMRTAVQLQPVVLATNRGIPAFAAPQTVQRITDASWLPVKIFNTGGRPIYYPPVAMFVAKLDAIALAFGTGDRENLWNRANNVEGRFYLIVDQGLTTMQTEANYVQITPAGAASAADFILDTPATGMKRGWYLRLTPNERVITKAFGLSGLIVFSAYLPDAQPPNPQLCGRTGVSRTYTLYASNGNAVLKKNNAYTRYQDSPVFQAPPTVDLGSTKNPTTTQRSAASLTAEQKDIMDRLKSFFPASCKFGNFWYNISAMGSDTRYIGIAAVPMCIIEHNWKEVQ